MAWTEASNILNSARRQRTLSSCSSTAPAEEEFLQEIASVIPKNIVAQRLKFLEKGTPSPASSSSTLVSTSETHQQNINMQDGGGEGEERCRGKKNPSSASGGVVASPVEKRHAVLAFEPSSNCFTVRDLNTTNGGGGRSGTSGVCSPSLTLDSGRGSSSAPSSPAKEMSPVQMMTSVVASSATNAATSGNGGSSSNGTVGSSTSNQSHNASPVFARKLSRPMEYLLGQGLTSNEVPGTTSSSEPFIGVDPHYSNVTGLSSGNYASFCSGSEPISFATSGSSGSRSSAAPSRNVDSGNGTSSSIISSSTTNNFNNSTNNNLSCGGFPNSDCEILQITEDFDDVVVVNDEENVVARKDSLEEDVEDVDHHHGQLIGRNQQVCGGDKSQVQPQFLVGGDIMQSDLNVPNEVFGPLSHAEILNRRNNLGGGSSNSASAYNNKTNNNLLNNSQHSSPASSSSGGIGGKQGSNHNRPVLVSSASAEGYGYTNTANNNNHAQTTTTPSARARSSSGGEGTSARSTPLSALYGTPHWWPDSPPPDQSHEREMGIAAAEEQEEDLQHRDVGFIVNCCPPPPHSSANASPFKKPFLLNHNNSLTNRLKGISSITASSAVDNHHPGKDLSLDGSTHSQQSSSTPCTTPPPSQQYPTASLQQQEGSVSSTNTMDNASTIEVKKFTPMAFTITLGDSNEVASEAAEAKKAAMAERLSKFAPRHRRNASLTKSDDVAVADHQHDTKSSSLGRTPHQQRQSSVTGGSDSSAVKCASLPKKLSSSAAKKHPSGGSNNDSGLRSLSPETISSTTSSSSRRSRPFINEATNAASSNSNKKPNFSSDNNSSSASNNNNCSMGRKSGGGSNNNQNNRSSASGRSGAGTPQARRSITPSEALRSNYKNGGNNSNKAENTTTTIKLNDLSKSPTSSSPQPAVVQPPLDKEDTASEAGTYTVEKETPEVQSARENIEQIFGLNDGEVEEDEEEGEMDKENNITAAALAAANGSSAKKSFGNVVVVGGAEPGTRDWVREWAELAAQQHQQKKQNNRPEMPDSQYFLRETETLVSAIQERVSKHMKSSVGRAASLGGGVPAGSDDSDQEDHPPHHQRLHHHQHLSPVKSLPQSQHSTPTNTANAKRRPPSRTSPFHRESSVLSDSGIRRGGGRNFGYESTDLMNNHQSMTTSTAAMLPLNNARGVSPRPAVSNSLSKFNNNIGNSSVTTAATNSNNSPNFSRNDGGRFSLRMAKSRTPPAQMPPPAPRQNTYSGGGGSGEAHNNHHVRGMMSNGHSARSSESREQSVGSSAGGAGGSKKYTASGKVLNSSGTGGLASKNKPGGNRSNSTLTAKEVELANWKRRKNYDPMKAAAEGKNKNGSKKNTNSNGVLSSGAESGGEGGGGNSTAMLPPIASPKVNRREAMMTKSLSFHQESYSPKCPSEDEDMIYIVDELDSSHSNSPNHLGGVAGGGMAGATGMAMTRSYHEDVMYYGLSGSPTTAGSMRPKNKLEALDNLVIATIHSLSNKVRTSSRHLLEKLQTQHANDENGALLEEMVSQLKELEAPNTTNNSSSSPNKSPSRELSGTLKNLKKLEQVVLVLDKVLCDGFDSDEVNG